MEKQKLADMIGLVKDANNSGMRLSLEEGELLIRVNKGKLIDKALVERLRTEKEALKEYFSLTGDPSSPGEKFPLEKAVPEYTDGQEYYPVSPVQTYWINPALDAEYKSQDNVHGKMLISYEIKGPLDIDALMRSVESVINYHEGLRLTFHNVQGSYKMRVEDAAGGKYQPVFYTRETSGEPLDAWDLNISGDFRLDQAPLFIVHITTTGEGCYYLSLNIPHAILDNWAVDILLNDLFHFYRLYAAGKAAELKPPAFTYKDYIYSEQQYIQKNYELHRQHWNSRFNHLPACPKWFGKSGMGQPADKKALQIESIVLQPDVYARLTGLAATHQCALFTVLNAAFRTYLHSATGEKDVLIGTYILGRDYPGTERLLGCFAKTKVLRVVVDEKDSVQELIQKVREHDRESGQYDACSLREAMEHLLPADFPPGSAFWNINLQFVSLSKRNVDDPSEASRFLNDTGLTLNKMPYLLNELIAIDMQFLFVATGTHLIAECQYDSSTYTASEIKSLLADFNGHISRLPV